MNGPGGSAGEIIVNALGPLEVIVGGRAVELPPAQRRLLSILAVEDGRDVSTDELIDRMWPGEPPPTARTAVQVHVSALRKMVPIETRPTGYRIATGAVLQDRISFEGLVEAAGSARTDQRWAEARASAAAAQALWRAEPYPDLADTTYALAVVSGLRELALQAADIEVEAMLALGDNEAAIHRLQEVIDRNPLHDRLRHHLMLALYRAGRQGEALRAYQAYRALLGETMGIEPGMDLRLLEEQILVHDSALGDRPAPPTPHNLPDTPTSFVGRESELRRVTEGLGEARIVTISGAPGLGKTRLVVEAGRSLLANFTGGVWFAGLSGARESASVVATIAAATSAGEGIDNFDALAGALRSRPILLILDNCEHVVEQVRRFLVALTSRPGECRVLLTSRQAISMHGGSMYRLELAPLAIEPNASVALLVDRVRAMDRGFTMTPENLDVLLELCRRLEGIPLGIELVARFVPKFGIRDITRLLDRVQTDDALEAAFEWSTALLTVEDRRLLHDLAVFESPFTVERAHQVCGDGAGGELATAGSISRLLDASLLVLDWSATSSRYRMLQPIRELAWSRADTTARRRLNRAHAQSIVQMSAEMSDATLDQRQALAFLTLDAEIADYRKALAWLRDKGQWGSMTAILEALSRYWYARFLGWEAAAWLDEVPIGLLEAPDRIRLHRVAGFLAWAVHDYDEADAHYTALCNIGNHLGDRLVEADGLYGRGLIHQKRRFLDGAGMLESAARIYEALDGRQLELGQCLLFRGLDEAYSGDIAVGERLLTRATSLLGEVGHLRQVSKAERWLAHCAWRRGDEAMARHYADRAEALARRLGDQIALGGALVEQANIAVTWGSTSDAARHLLEALEPIPVVDEIDVSQVLIPAARLARRAGHPQLVASILGRVNDVYHRHGWRPFDEVPDAADLRAAATTPTGGEVLDRVRDFLEELASNHVGAQVA
jgi:predicted ATPase/DNA-binding SARP family transcriptional activator